MATIRYFINAKKRKLAPVYVRFSAGRGNVFIEDTGLLVDPETWSNKTQTIKQRIRTKADEELIAKLYGSHDKKQKIDIYGFDEHINSEIKNHQGNFTAEWLKASVDRFNNRLGPESKTLNAFIDTYIKEAKAGTRKNADKMLFAEGTVKGWEVFKRNFNEYQGIYTAKRLKYRRKENKPIRPRRIIDFKDIDIDFYNDFVNVLTDEGFGINTIGRHVKELKYFLNQAMQGSEPLHDNIQFKQKAFATLTTEAFSIYLTESEIEKIYNLDLSKEPENDVARDAFIVLCETALRISDYKKVDLNIRAEEDGTKLIRIYQTKTGGEVIIPLSDRLEAILDKYNGNLPKVYEQYVNIRIKKIAERAGINDILTYPVVKYGKKYETTKSKWELVSCHTGRRSACTNMYLAGIPAIDIMQISGHRTEKIFLKYIKVTKKQTALKLAKHAYFNRLKAV